MSLKKIAAAFCMLVSLAGCSGKKSMTVTADESTMQAEFARTVGDRVHFGFDSSELSAESKATLQRQAEWLGKNAKIRVTVEGHCDERGTREYNLALGEKRAAAAQRFLQSIGVDASRIETISYGKERPAAIGEGEEVWKLNRRAVTVLQ